MLRAPGPPPHVTHTQPLPNYTNINEIESRLNGNMERKVNANVEKMKRMITKQFSQLASSTRELGTFLVSQK